MAEESSFSGLSVADENTAAAMCYTSGTTGNPKGVRLLAPLDLPALAGHAQVPTTSALAETDIVLPVVPMFHANAWGHPYAVRDRRIGPGDARART